MKKIFAIVCSCLLCAALTAGELTTAFLSSNQKFNSDASFSYKRPHFGALFILRDEIGTNIDSILSFEADPINGNTLFARVLFKTSFLEISAGPSFGVLNKGSKDSGITNLFQPGLGMGFSIIAPGIIVARVDTDFALPSPADSGGIIYLQKSSISAGFYLPNILCSLAVNQKTHTESGYYMTSITDYGFYTEAFRKGSNFRISVDFIYRISDFFIAEDDPGNKKLGNLVLGGGITWAPNMDFNLFLLGTGSVYTFSLKNPETSINDPLFEIKSGITMKIDTNRAHKENLLIEN